MNYIENDIKKGIAIDWKLIRREFKRLKIPRDVYSPLSEPLEQCKYFFELSERSTGKTTSWLLLGMILNKEYGIITHYIRSKEYMIENKTIKDLMSVITSDEYGYVEKITNGKYNSCMYHARRWYYCNRDDNGAIIDQADKHFMICMSVDKSDDYKSSYTCPVGDLIIFDEFISKSYPPNETVFFLDLCKTIIRDRWSPIIVLCANTINKQAIQFDEYEIKKDIADMKLGDQRIIETSKGTKMCVHLITQTKMTHLKRINNTLYFGFNNPKLNAITGGDWSVDVVPHIPHNYECEVISRNHYIKISSELVRLTLVKFDMLGYAVLVTPSTTLYDDSIIYTCDDINDHRFRYGIGYTKLDSIIWNLYRKNKWYYATNEQGAIVKSYINQVKRRL